MAAIPMFGSGAMENWGLILYQEKYLLWDPKESTESEKLSVTSVIAHELAHMVRNEGTPEVSASSQ